MQSEAIRSNQGRLVGEPFLGSEGLPCDEGGHHMQSGEPFLGSEGLPCEAIRGDQRLCSEAVEADSRPSWDAPEARAPRSRAPPVVAMCPRWLGSDPPLGWSTPKASSAGARRRTRTAGLAQVLLDLRAVPRCEAINGNQRQSGANRGMPMDLGAAPRCVSSLQRPLGEPPPATGRDQTQLDTLREVIRGHQSPS